MSLFERKVITNRGLVLGNTYHLKDREKNAFDILDQRLSQFFLNLPLWLNTIKTAGEDRNGLLSLSMVTNNIWNLCYQKDGLFVGPIPSTVDDQWFYTSFDDISTEVKKSTCTFYCFPNDIKKYNVDGLVPSLDGYVLIGKSVSNVQTVSQWTDPKSESQDNTYTIPNGKTLYGMLVEEYRNGLTADLKVLYSFAMMQKGELRVFGY